MDSIQLSHIPLALIGSWARIQLHSSTAGLLCQFNLQMKQHCREAFVSVPSARLRWNWGISHGFEGFVVILQQQPCTNVLHPRWKRKYLQGFLQCGFKGGLTHLGWGGPKSWSAGRVLLVSEYGLLCLSSLYERKVQVSQLTINKKMLKYNQLLVLELDSLLLKCH